MIEIKLNSSHLATVAALDADFILIAGCDLVKDSFGIQN
jgi:hypothetical protein